MIVAMVIEKVLMDIFGGTNNEIIIMENKYYTPSIEEFFVGFEFEHKDPCYDGREEFQKAVVESDNLVRYPDEDGMFNYWETEHLLSNILYDVKENNIRVKFLDASDIEELGFTVVKTKGNSFEAVKKFTFTYDNYPSEGEYNIIMSGDKYCVIKLKDIGETTLFRGEIKNKNVLKQVFKMLDIK